VRSNPKIKTMEKMPIKRNEHIVKLSKDHHFTLLFCWKIRSGLKLKVEPERIIKYVQYFWNKHMQPHFNEEETILFASVKNDAAVQKALNEHTQIQLQIKALGSLANNAQEELSALADTVDNHIRYEERELFPHLERILSNEQLKVIGNQLMSQHDPVSQDNFADQFWLKK
jgi:hemerythrin-like domain-containing protein